MARAPERDTRITRFCRIDRVSIAYIIIENHANDASREVILYLLYTHLCQSQVHSSTSVRADATRRLSACTSAAGTAVKRPMVL